MGLVLLESSWDLVSTHNWVPLSGLTGLDRD